MANLSVSASNNIPIIDKELINYGIKNDFVRAAILALSAEESGLNPKNELSYKNTDNAKLRTIFGSRLSDLNEDQLSSLKQNDIAFFEKVYGGLYGNSQYGDGYKYRGRGFNGETFKSEYIKRGNQINIDLVNNPDLLNNVDIAAKVLAVRFIDSFKSSGGKLQNLYHANDINDFKDLDTAVLAISNSNMGWGKDVNTFQRLNEVKKYAPLMYEYVTGSKKKINEWLSIAIITIIIFVILLMVIPGISNYKFITLIIVAIGSYFLYQNTDLKYYRL